MFETAETAEQPVAADAPKTEAPDASIPVPETRADALQGASSDQKPADTGSPPKPAEPRPSRRFIELQKKERELKRKEQELRQLEEKLPKNGNQKPASYSADQLRMLAKQNPDAFLREFGIDARYVNEFFLNKNQPTPEMAQELQKDELQRQMQELREEQKRFIEQQRQNEEHDTVAEWARVAESIVASDEGKQRFELLNAMHDDPVNEIYQRIADDYAQQVDEGLTPKIKNIEDVAAEIENELVDGLKMLLQSATAKRFLQPSQEKKIVNDVEAKPGQASPTEPVSEEDPLEAYARKLLEVERSQATETEQTPDQRVAISQGHMQTLPDTNSENLEKELYLKALEELRKGY
jgi:hypothetical protein